MEHVSKEILIMMPVTEEQKRELEAKAASGRYNCCFRYTSRDKLKKEDVERANVIAGNVPPAMLADARNLEWLQLNSAGADQYTVPGVLPPGTILTNATGAYGLSVSEHMVAMVFDLIRRFNQYHRNQARHEWKAMGNIISVEGSVVLILGLGDIGGDFARKMKALGAYTIGVRRTEKEKPDYLDEQYTLEKLDDLLSRADITAMILPGGDATSHLMDERRLRLMKPGSYLINAGRGSAIDPKALYKVLKEGHLGGCGLDVTEPEPLPAGDPLWDLGNLFITPHVAGNFFLAETFLRIVRIVGENLEAWCNGKELKNVVDFETGYRK